MKQGKEGFPGRRCYRFGFLEHMRVSHATSHLAPSEQDASDSLTRYALRADIGGSYKESDLSFLTLSWLVSETESFLAFDYNYLRRLVVGKAVAPWGAMEAHQCVSRASLVDVTS